MLENNSGSLPTQVSAKVLGQHVYSTGFVNPDGGSYHLIIKDDPEA
jgi:hypothetical protein